MGPLTLSAIGLLPDIAMRPSTAPQQAYVSADAATDFASVMKSYAGSAATTLREGEAAALSGIQGSMPLQTVVEKMMAAERTLQASIGVRDKLVSSYLEISRMQI